MKTRKFFGKGSFGFRRIAANEAHFEQLTAVPSNPVESVVQSEQRLAITAWEEEGGTVRRRELRF